jgi:hypothetical protein
MKAEQFDVLITLMRGSPESAANIAARLVLVEGWSQADAHRKTGATRQTISDYAKKYNDAFKLVTEAWAPKKRAPKATNVPVE